MKLLATILLAFSLVASLLARTPVDRQQPPDVAVLTYDWGVPHSTTFKQNPGYSADSSTPRDDRNRREREPETQTTTLGSSRHPGDLPPPRQRKVEQTVTRLETYARVKNTGDKRIKSISWRYMFYADQNGRQEVKRYDFRSKADILPGEEKTLVKQVVDRAPTRYQSVVIDKIEYSDGSKWQR
jgi:hypothetical protein